MPCINNVSINDKSDFMDKDSDAAFICIMIFATTLLNLYDELSERGAKTKTQIVDEFAHLCPMSK